MRIALINPNRLRKPPVIPVGLEYLAHALRRAGHEATVLDLCFVDDLPSAMDGFLSDLRPDAVFLSIRNVDSAVRPEGSFYLDEHRTIAERITGAGYRLVVGGAGVTAMPAAVARHLGAEAVVTGPGEAVAVKIADMLISGRPLPPVLDGFAYPPDSAGIPERCIDVDYARYYRENGIAGFASSYGCPCTCPFCVEAGTRVRFRRPEAVAAEVRTLVEKGWSRLHLCDAEMNVSLGHAVALCEALAGLGAVWITYMRHKPISAALAAAMRQSGCEMATVTVNSAADNPTEAAACVRLLKNHDIRVAIDLSCGLPGETPQQARAMIDALRKAEPQRVGVNTQFRVYPGAPLAAIIQRNPNERKWLTGDPTLFRPAVYCRFDPVDVQRWIDGLPGFALDVGEAVNYQRLGQSQRREP